MVTVIFELAALELAAGWLTLADDRANVLVSTALNADMSWFDRWRSGGWGIALGDGAAAMVLGRGTGLLRAECVNSLTYGELEAMHRGSLPLFQQEIEDSRPLDVAARATEFAIASGYDAIDFHRMFTTMYGEVVDRSSKEAGITAGQVSRVLFSNLSESIAEVQVLQPLGLKLADTAWDLGRTIGHIGAADHAIGLEHLIRTGQLAVGEHVLLLGGAAGYSVASSVFILVQDLA